jgi:hypothetical protein
MVNLTKKMEIIGMEEREIRNQQNTVTTILF